LIETLVCILLAVGTFFITVSSVGLLRLPDVYGRLHAVTKGSTLGIAGILAAAALWFYAAGYEIGAEFVVMGFVLLTGVPLTDDSVIDEMRRAGEKGGAAHDQV
jgi:monovalent cation/proton antiporter MnhG/PhaG subunit